MMKKLSILAVLLCMALTLTSCGSRDIGEYYEAAQLYLGCKDYAYAAELFEQLGEYADSADYALYARALQAIEEENFALARANFEVVNPFKSSGRYLMYLDARDEEADGKLEDALALYEQLGSFMGANQAVEHLEKAIPEAVIKEGRALMNKGDYVAARELFLSLDGYGASKALADNCTLALNKAAYSEADKLEESGDLLGAMEAFTALGEALDAAERAADCRAAIHAELDTQYAAVTLATAPNLMDAYAALEDDEIASARTAELTARFGKNLELITMSGAYVELGAYPQAESGAEQPVRWAVIKREGAVLTLLSVNVLDASAEAMAPAIVFNEAEAAAVSEVQLPSVADLALLNDRTAAATAYALAQGVASEEGATSFWLRDSLENGMHPVIAPSGTLSLPAEGAVYGLRPLITLNLDSFSFASGSGTENDPFRAE